MKFTPFPGYVEIEPFTAHGVILSDEKKFVEMGKVISKRVNSYDEIDVGDIIFFRPHGFFETPEYEGKKHYVVRVDSEFILGKISNVPE